MRSKIQGVLVLALLFSMVPFIFAQGDTIPLEAFTDDTYGLQGVIPEGWEVAGPGVHIRSADPTDITLVAVQASPVSLDDLWAALLPQFGLDEVPEPIGNHTGTSFDYTLYQFDIDLSGVQRRFDVAMVEETGRTIVVLLQTTANDYEQLHGQVFLPMLDALAPYESPEELPYQVEDVTFPNEDITLAGTLTVPAIEGQHPAVVLMTGSGPNNRDEMLVPGFPIFRVIADYLTRQGIAVLRYDDRGVGQSSGEFIETDLHDFASDGQAAVDFLLTRDDINPAQVGLLGHSEGGYYAQIIAANPDSNVAFVVLMAGPTVSGVDVLLAQNEEVFGQAGMTPAFIQRRKDFLMELFPLVVNRDFDAAGELTYEYSLEQWENLTEEARSVIGAEDAESYAQIQREAVLDQMSAEWWVSFIEYDPRVDLAAVNVPMLAVFGSLDIQVSPEANVAALETSLDESGNPDVTIITLEDANHLFQAAVTGSIEEYFELELDFTPDFLPTVGEWILEHVDIVVE